jgi:hypothetical protein
MIYKDTFFNIGITPPEGFIFKEIDLGLIKKIAIEETSGETGTLSDSIGMYLIQTGYDAVENYSIFISVGRQIFAHLLDEILSNVVDLT